jgi:hypothetical protein
MLPLADPVGPYSITPPVDVIEARIPLAVMLASAMIELGTVSFPLPLSVTSLVLTALNARTLALQ